MHHGRAYAGLVVCAALWGMVFVSVAELLPHLNATQIVSVRFALVAIGFAAAFAARPALLPRLRRAEWGLIVVCGVLAVPGSQYAIVEAQNYLSPPLASLIVTSSPAIAAVFAATFLRDRLTVLQAAGFAIALVGVALILLIGAGSGSSEHHSSPLGAAIAVITPVSWALYTLALKPLAGRHAPVGTVGVVMIVGALALSPTFGEAASALDTMSGHDWAWMLALVLGFSIVPNILWFESLRHLPVHQTTAFMYVIPVFATLGTAVVLGREPSAITIPGGLLVIAGVALAQWPRARLRTVGD
jgi:drug/metabolite transporter (DMT)-like permease